jgi:hypothetical protein
MTTGCSCGTSGCQGITCEPGGRCPRCQIAATPRGIARTVRQVIHAVLNGPDISTGDLLAGRHAAGKEAGS